MESTTSFVMAENMIGMAKTAYNAALPAAIILLGSVVLLYIVFVIVVSRNSHTVGSVLKMHVGGKKGSRPPIAPFGMLECIRCMTSEQQPWFPLRARKALNDNDTFVLPLPRRPVMTGDFALAREILMDPLSIKPKTYQEFEPFGIGSIFTRNGSYWHSRRKGAAPAFSNRHVKRMNQVALERTEKWIQDVLIPCANEGKSFDVSAEMLSITLEAICKTAFEYDVSEHEKDEFLNNSELVFKEFLTKSINNPIRKYVGRWIPDRRKALDAARSNVNFAKRIIARYKTNPNPLKGTIIDHLVKNPCYANEDELAADVLLYLTAGHDTTAYTMAFTLLELARNPDEQTKVRDDISSMDSVDQWRRSDALQMAIKESMRLYPVSASGSSRVCGRDFVTKEGWTIPKGTSVVSHIMMTHRNKKVFGETADEYVPSRWENPTDAQKESFLIFSAGKQNCVGQSLAQAELHCIIPRILSEVELEVEDEGKITWFLTLKPVGARLRPKLVVHS
jgi:cytochrome P450